MFFSKLIHLTDPEWLASPMWTSILIETPGGFELTCTSNSLTVTTISTSSQHILLIAQGTSIQPILEGQTYLQLENGLPQIQFVIEVPFSQKRLPIQTSRWESQESQGNPNSHHLTDKGEVRWRRWWQVLPCYWLPPWGPDIVQEPVWPTCVCNSEGTT